MNELAGLFVKVLGLYDIERFQKSHVHEMKITYGQINGKQKINDLFANSFVTCYLLSHRKAIASTGFSGRENLDIANMCQTSARFRWTTISKMCILYHFARKAKQDFALSAYLNMTPIAMQHSSHLNPSSLLLLKTL